MMSKTSIDQNPENVIKPRMEYAIEWYYENIQYSHKLQ